MKKSVVKISSGMGNQIFQYAFAYAFSKKNNMKLILDPLFAKGDSRAYKLDFYAVTEPRFIPKWIDDIILKKCKNTFHRMTQIREWKYKWERYDEYLEEEEYVYHEVYPKGDHTVLKGYFQSWKYFDQYYDELKEKLVFHGTFCKKALEYYERIGENSCSLHIRRTDYCLPQYSYAIDSSFYKTAVEEMVKQNKDTMFFVFSDDIEYAREILDGKYSHVFVSGLSDVEDFELMRMCKNHIIANSTFSWWAAYLGENRGNYVIAPEVGLWKKEYYLPSWITIETRFEHEKTS